MADNCLPEDVNGGKIVPKSRDRAMTEGTWPLVNKTFASSDVDPKELVRKMRETLRRTQIGVDAFVVHEDAMQKLRELVFKPYPRPELIDPEEIFLHGIPIYSRPSDRECIELANELRSQGKRVAITLSESYLPDGIDSWLKKDPPPDPPLDAGDQAPNFEFEHHVFRYADDSAFRKASPPDGSVITFKEWCEINNVHIGTFKVDDEGKITGRQPFT
jgi:hypothetical protein